MVTLSSFSTTHEIRGRESYGYIVNWPAELCKCGEIKTAQGHTEFLGGSAKF